MKTHSILFGLMLVVLLSQLCLAQSYSEYSIKEQYDQRQITFIENSSNNPCIDGIDYITIANLYGDKLSYVLESYIRMYETTKDKAYLIKFILNAICMHENRKDVLGVYNHPHWSNDMYQDGNIIWAMSHFVYLIKKQEPALNTLTLPPNIIPYNDFGYYGTNQWSTYGAFAEWLRVKTEQTLDWYTYGNSINGYKNYWADDYRCYTPEQDPGNSTFAQQMNQQAGFACALFYFGITDYVGPEPSDYLHKAAQIAKAYKGFRTEHRPNLIYGCLYSWLYSANVLYLNSYNNSYKWGTYGWRELTCSEYQDGYNDYEDISHGVQTLIFPRAINERLWSDGSMLFTDNDMLRYRNTFYKNIFAGYSDGCPQFHAGVDGDDEITYKPSLGGLNTLSIRSLAWMPFYKYDGATSELYDVIMDYYNCSVKDNINNVSEGMDFYGLSEVVAAQWDKECVNLTLYNRDVVYNQDFEAKNDLVVAPKEAGSAEPFAEPKTFTDGLANNRFVIEAGNTVNMVAGEKIVLKAGFHAKAGSHFRASISTTCTGSSKAPLITDNFTNEENLFKSSKIEPPKPDTVKFNNYDIFSIAAYPNPFNNTTTIEYNIPYSTDVNISIFDIYGSKIMQPVNQYLEKGEHSNTVNMSHISKGIYYCKLKSGNQSKTIKLVLSN